MEFSGLLRFIAMCEGQTGYRVFVWAILCMDVVIQFECVHIFECVSDLYLSFTSRLRNMRHAWNTAAYFCSFRAPHIDKRITK